MSLRSPSHEPPPTSRTEGARVRRVSVAAVVALAAALLSPIIASTPAVAADSAPSFAADYLNGVSGPKTAREVDLSGTWDFAPLTNTVCTGGGRYGTTTGPFVSCVDSPAPGGKTTIAVPGGGWYKQGWTDLSRATYSKTIQIPKISGEQVTRLNFGAINHRATVAVDGRVVGTQTSSYTSSVFDLSDFVKPGSSHTDRAKRIVVRGTMASANKSNFAYPRIPLSTKLIPANSTEKITVGPLRWKAGTDSYWTPNVPYQADSLQTRGRDEDLAIDADAQCRARKTTDIMCIIGYR